MSEIYESRFVGEIISFEVDYCYATFLRFNNIEFNKKKNIYPSYYDYNYNSHISLYETMGFLSKESSEKLLEIGDNKGIILHPIYRTKGGFEIQDFPLSKKQYEYIINNPLVLSAKVVVYNGDIISIEKRTILENNYIMNEIKKMIDYDYEKNQMKSTIKSQWGVRI